MPAVHLTGGHIDEVRTVREVSRVKDVSIKALPCPKVNDAGLTGAWWWIDKIAIAVAIWATTESYKAAKEEYDIGKRYYNLAKDQWNHFYEHFRPLEEQELAEIFAEDEHKPEYEKAIAGHTDLIEPIFARAEQRRKDFANKYCVCNDISEFTRTEFVKSSVRGDGDNFARRYAERLAQELNDIRWARMIAAAARGRGLLSASTAFASKAASFFDDYAKAMAGVAEDAIGFSSYIRSRFQTVYNPTRARIDGLATVPHTYRGFDAQGYWQWRGIPMTQPSGGITWGDNVGKSYTQVGFDPTGMVQVSRT